MPPPAADPPQALSGELGMQSVRLTSENVRFIPGPPAGRMRVLRTWCQENCEGKWQSLGNGFDWLFTDAGDAEAFRLAWNSRRELKPDETLTGETDGE